MTLSLIAGVSYRLVNDTKIGNCSFHKGDVVIYSSGGYSHYDDCYIYHFIDASGEKRICISQVELTAADMENFEGTSRE